MRVRAISVDAVRGSGTALIGSRNRLTCRVVWESPNIARCDYRPKPARKRREQPELKCGRIVTATPPKRLRGPVIRLKEQSPAPDERPPRSAIVEPKRAKGTLAHLLLDEGPEAHQKRGDAADALFREIARRVAASKRE